MSLAPVRDAARTEAVVEACACSHVWSVSLAAYLQRIHILSFPILMPQSTCDLPQACSASYTFTRNTPRPTQGQFTWRCMRAAGRPSVPCAVADHCSNRHNTSPRSLALFICGTAVVLKALPTRLAPLIVCADAWDRRIIFGTERYYYKSVPLEVVPPHTVVEAKVNRAIWLIEDRLYHSVIEVTLDVHILSTI